MKFFLPLAVIAVSLPSCAAFQIFGFNFGEADSTNEIARIAKEQAVKIADDFSAGSGESVCRVGDAICEASASTPKSANEQGAPRYCIACEISLFLMSVSDVT